MALAIGIGASVEYVQFNIWILASLLIAALLSRIPRLVRRTSFKVLEGSAIATLWVTTRFIATPAIILVGVAWLLCRAFNFAAAPILLNALTLLCAYGCGAILVTSILANLAVAIKGPRRDSPSAS